MRRAVRVSLPKILTLVKSNLVFRFEHSLSLQGSSDGLAPERSGTLMRRSASNVDGARCEAIAFVFLDCLRVADSSLSLRWQSFSLAC